MSALLDTVNAFENEFVISSFPKICNSTKHNMSELELFPIVFFIVQPINKYGILNVEDTISSKYPNA